MSVPSQGKLTNWLLSCLTAGFIAWAGLVWNIGDRIMLKLNEIYADVQSQGVQIDYLENGLTKHEAKPWHPAAGEEISRMRGNNDRR